MPLPRTRPFHKPRLGTRPIHGHPLTIGLEACYLFNEGNGNRAFDVSGNGHDIQLGFGTTDKTNTAWVGGHFNGPALHCKATTAANSGNLNRNFTFGAGDSFTFAAWVFPIASTDGYGSLLTFNGSQGLFARNSGGAFHLTYYDGVDRNPIHVQEPFDHWYHVAVSLNVGATTRQLTFYFNGEFDGTATPGSVTALWNCALNDTASETFAGYLDGMMVWKRVLAPGEIRDLFIQPFDMFSPVRTIFPLRTPTYAVSAISADYRVSTPIAFRQETLDAPATRAIYRPGTSIVTQPARAVFVDYVVQRIRRTLGSIEITPTPGRIVVRANSLTARIIHRVDVSPGALALRANALQIDRGTFTVPAVRAQYRANVPFLDQEVASRDCGDIYDRALAQHFIAGDWLIEAAAIGLKLSLHYDPDGTWEHRITDISPIEISAPPGGGMASVSNVTISVAETGEGQSIVQIWEQVQAVDGVTVTIDFLLDGQISPLRVFTGRIDTMHLSEAVTQIFCVDDSIHRNLLLPQRLVTSNIFANADSRVLTQPMPLVYGEGNTVVAAPLMLVDVPTNTYLTGDHLMSLTSTIAIFVPDVGRFLTYDANATLCNTSALVTLNTPLQEVRFNQLSGALSINENVFTQNATAAIDGISTTIANIVTSALDSNLDGYGAMAALTSMDDDQRGNNTVLITLTNHRRAPDSDPTVTGTFFVRTRDAATNVLLRDNLFVTEHFRHTAHPLTTAFTVPALNLGATELLEVRCVARNEGGPGRAGGTTTNSVTTTTAAATWYAAIGSPGSGPAQFSGPLGIAIHPTTGDIYIADSLNNRVMCFTSDGVYFQTFGTTGSGPAQFSLPYGIAVDAVNNYIVVVDNGNNRVQRFTTGGIFVDSFGSAGSGDGQFAGPTGIAISAGGIWVVDTGQRRIQQFSLAGAYVGQFGGQGILPGQFEAPIGIALRSNGDIWVTDFTLHKVQIFTSVGVYTSQFGGMGSAPGNFNNPAGIVLDSTTGDAYVVDSSNHRVERFTSAGVLLGVIGSAGGGDGQFQNPYFVALNAAGNTLVVTDYGNARAQFFEVSMATTTTTTTTTIPGDVYEVGDIGIESFYQPTGDSPPLFLYDDNWHGRRDTATGRVTSIPYFPFRTCAHVIESMMVLDMGLEVDYVSFAAAYTYEATRGLWFDGGIGYGWHVQRSNARTLLDDAARQGIATLAPTFLGVWGLIPYRLDTPVADSFDVGTILATEGAENAAGDERGSTFEVTLGNLENVHTRFEVHYHYNAGSQQFDKVYYVDENGTNSPDQTIQGACEQAFMRYGKLEPMVIEAYWIADDFTAQSLLRHIVEYFSAQRLTVQFDTTFRALCRQVTDRINVTYPFLPAADNGQAFEIHTIRILPLQGRVQLVASKAAILQQAVNAPPVRAVYRVGGIASVPIPQLSVDYVVQTPIILAQEIIEPWEFQGMSTQVTLFTETWSF